ncbi:hypothetical protein KDW_57560 [Dictyobacter vulcani]|uniref:Glutamine--fructose-6-phosphate aminotransferase [isomerizing] n=1 Tax=Dictyobacter vulcani TaxID=2607529 RepID=A0A5J4KQE0_9CHLR|nr:SIS domain-containing protein [Dictyobacter vulcani]GER91594.1 hypothetical protein KDW_57560 [Dictyobacter vulcani]
MNFALDAQIASQPEAIARVLAQVEVPTLDAGRPLIFAGIGTSLHACRVAAHWLYTLSGGRILALALSAHDLALTAPLTREHQVVVVSHRGTKRFPGEALRRARELGAYTVAITSIDAPEPEADVILRTCPGELSSTHTVSYTTALAVLAKLVGTMSGEHGQQFLTGLQNIPAAIEATLAEPAPVAIAEQLAGREPILLAGMGIDAITAAEAALKIKEGTYQWAEGIETENALHGPPAALRAGMGAVLITSSLDDAGRTRELRTALKSLDVATFTCGTGFQDDLRFASVDTLLRPFVAIVPLQRLTAEIARIRHTNPDAIHTDQEPWTTIMASYSL